ncbi:MAG TPA: hypothetical protein IAA36_03560 [Candidatus Eubacterium pullicola]|nr:hypothetical protein [Candidatus Eubacterium pullicola]
MREKLKYTPLAIACIVTDICLFIGVLFTYLPFGRLKSGNYYSALGATQGGYQFVIYLMMIAAAVMIALTVLRILYFIMRERKPAVIISAAAGFVGVVLILAFFSKLISMLMNISSLLYGSSVYSGVMSSTVFMVIALIIIAVVIAFDVIILLCMRGNIKAEGLCKLMPSLKKNEIGVSARPVMMNIVGALIFSLGIVVIYIRLSSGNVMGLISGIVTWAIFLIAAMAGIIAIAIMMFMFDRKYGRNKLMFINTIVNTVLGVLILLSVLMNLLGESGASGAFSLIILIVAIADAVLQIGLILCVMDVIKVKGMEEYVAQTAAAGVAAQPQPVPEMQSETTPEIQPETAADNEPTEQVVGAAINTETENVVPVSGAGNEGGQDDGSGNDATIEAAEATAASTAPAAEKEKFFKTKKGKITLGAIIAAAVIIVALIVWAVFFNKTEIDAFEDIQIEYTGDNGQGYAYVSAGDIDYDMNEPGVGYFVNSLYYDVENNGQLSNGDKVKITVQYSKATADGLDIKLKEESKEFEVSGLIEKYASAADIDPELYDKAYQEAIESAEDRAYGDKQSKFYKAYYVTEQRSDGTYGNNDLVFVFQETYETYDIESKGNVKKTRYIGMYTNFDSGYNEDGYYMYSMTLTTPGTYDYVEKEDGILPALQDEFKSYFDDYKINIEEVNISM